MKPLSKTQPQPSAARGSAVGGECLLRVASKVRAAAAHGVRAEDAIREITHPTDPPKVQAVIDALGPYGHEEWCRDRARNIASVLIMEPDKSVDAIHEMLVHPNGRNATSPLLVPFEAAAEVLRAWRGDA